MASFPLPLEWVIAALCGFAAGFALASLFAFLTNKRMGETFKALSGDVLQSNNRLFLDLAKSVLAREQEQARHEWDKRAAQSENLLKPLQEGLTRLDTQTREMEKLRIGAYESLKHHISGMMEAQQHLRAETAQLKQALRRPEGRGRWGEMQLKRVLDMAGMMEHCDFVEQEHKAGEDGALRPDVVVKLPSNRNIIIDCKTPLDALLDGTEADGDTAFQQQRIRHARNVRDHVKKLSHKNYWQQFDESPDFVVMFVPGEHVLSLAVQQDPDLFDYAFQNKIILASPINLIGLLKTIAHTWRQEKLAENARRIADLGKELYDALADVARPLNDLGENLRKAVTHFNRAANVFETKAFARARRLSDECSIQSEKEITTPELVEVAPRTVAYEGDDEPEQLKPTGT